ncbi:MAG: hypothetical protein WC769_00960, partial [Thermodesulfovibrionales bacterium]
MVDIRTTFIEKKVIICGLLFLCIIFLSVLGCKKNEVAEYQKGPGSCTVSDKAQKDIEKTAEVNYENKVKLMGLTVEKLSESQLIMGYYWQIIDVPGKYKQVFVHFADVNGVVLFQNDHELCNKKPLESVRGKFIKETYVVDVPKEAAGKVKNMRIG